MTDILSLESDSMRVCPRCGYSGQGIDYFRRPGHLALLIGASLFTYGIGGPTEWTKRAREWRSLGATHLSVNTMGSGLSARQHIDAIVKMKPALDAA